MTFKVVESGWYRTRDGRLAEVVCNPKGQDRPALGYVENELCFRSWSVNGHFDKSPLADADLIEYLGKERPKQPKIKVCTIGQQPEGSVMVPGSERSQD